MGGGTNQATSKCHGTKFKSFYLRVEGRTKSLTSVLVEIYVLLFTGGRMNHVTYECLGQNLSLPTFEWKDEPSQ